MMVTAAAVSAQIVSAVSSSPVALSDISGAAPQSQFKDIYQSVPTEDIPQGAINTKPKIANSKEIDIKKPGSGDTQAKVSIPASPAPLGVILPRAPLPRSAAQYEQSGDSQPAAEAGGRPAVHALTPQGPQRPPVQDQLPMQLQVSSPGIRLPKLVDNRPLETPAAAQGSAARVLVPAGTSHAGLPKLADNRPLETLAAARGSETPSVPRPQRSAATQVSAAGAGLPKLADNRPLETLTAAYGSQTPSEPRPQGSAATQVSAAGAGLPKLADNRPLETLTAAHGSQTPSVPRPQGSAAPQVSVTGAGLPKLADNRPVETLAAAGGSEMASEPRPQGSAARVLVPAGADQSQSPASLASAASTDTDSKKASRGNGQDQTRVPVSLPSLQSLGTAAQVILPNEQSTTSQPAADTGSSSTGHAPTPQGAFPLIAADAQVTLPRIDTHAFSMRLVSPDSKPNQPEGQQRPPVQNQSPSEPRNQTPREVRSPAAPQPAVTPNKSSDEVEPVRRSVSSQNVMPAEQFSSISAEVRHTALATESSVEPMPTSRTITAQDVQPLLPEMPKAPASTEILLQLAGKDQPSAAVRVIDRSGTVNVTVHASDPELRNSLRSNLGELASQLSGQGFKTEVVKPAVIAARPDNQQDPRNGGQRSPDQQQQPGAQSDRQPSRDKRSASGQWLQELENETSGNAGSRRSIN